MKFETKNIKKALIPVLVVVIGGLVWFLTQQDEPSGVTPVVVESSDVEVAGLEQEIEVSEEDNQADIVIRGEAADSEFQDGTYRSLQMYRVPNGQTHDVDVTLTLENDRIAEYVLRFDDGQEGGSTESQVRFAAALQDIISGQEIEELDLARVGGASLTTDSFNDALADVMSQASTNS